MPYLRGALVKEAIQNIATSEQCSGIRCYARKRASELGSHYLGEATQVIGTTIGAAAGSAVVSGVVGVGGAVIGSASKCVLNPPKTYVGASLCVAGTLLTICSVIPTPAAPYCASAAGMTFYGASKL